MKYRALTDLSLRQSKNPKDPKYEQWYEWPAGTVFEPPQHMNVALSLERGIVEPVDGGPMPVSVAADEDPEEEEVSDDGQE
jgi:hypothetical protein